MKSHEPKELERSFPQTEKEKGKNQGFLKKTDSSSFFHFIRKWLQDELERLRSVISKKSKKADSERVVLKEKDGDTKSSSLESVLADRVVGDEKKSSKESATEKTDSPGGGIAKAIKDAKDKIFSKKSDESEGEKWKHSFEL